ncbi:N2-acetyl-L-ornithine:2-oxoglutarate 5-aminotransferase [Aureococcus anophagefferens]|nr:N2-acetyl-L-ornithine:2-oxoglutarate 5-aminotransferase [Aureococcus anophagefferens]
MALSQILVALALSSAAALTRSPMRMSATATPTHVTTKSDAIMAEAKTVMPGGVSSPVRAFKSVGGDPIVFDSVKGAYAFDVDGNQRGARVRRNPRDARPLVSAAARLGRPSPRQRLHPAVKEFLEGIRALTEKNGALLVFDEVMTGFRISYGGAQRHFGVTPGVTAMGKVIGGLPVGAYGGKKEIMEMVAPAGPMRFEILAAGPVEKLAALTEKLVEGVLAEGKAAGHAICGGSISGMFGFFFCDGPVANFQEATASDTDKFARWHRAMLERGVYLAPSQYEAGFMSLAHTEEDVEKTIAAAKGRHHRGGTPAPDRSRAPPRASTNKPAKGTGGERAKGASTSTSGAGGQAIEGNRRR